jgi:hypothetical protein
MNSTYVYPTDMYEISKEENGGVNGVFEVPNLCMVTLEGEFNMVRNWGAKCLRNMKKPKLTNGDLSLLSDMNFHQIFKLFYSFII